MKPSMKTRSSVGRVPVTKKHRLSLIVEKESQRVNGRTATSILEELIKKEYTRQFGGK